MTFFQVALAAVTGVSLILAAYFAGRRSNRDEAGRWRDEHDMQKTARTRLEATLAEKDLAMVAQADALAAQGRRLEEKDKVISELGGTRVAEMLLAMQQESTKLFHTLTRTLESHETRAAERHSESSERHAELVKTLRQLNGKDRHAQ